MKGSRFKTNITFGISWITKKYARPSVRLKFMTVIGS